MHMHCICIYLRRVLGQTLQVRMESFYCNASVSSASEKKSSGKVHSIYSSAQSSWIGASIVQYIYNSCALSTIQCCIWTAIPWRTTRCQQRYRKAQSATRLGLIYATQVLYCIAVLYLLYMDVTAVAAGAE